ncbi:tRNA synthetase class I [Xylariaceae sp. FL1272]|nr:tRNA synthetase class I [Xylariaceae sp. FL1272]
MATRVLLSAARRTGTSAPITTLCRSCLLKSLAATRESRRSIHESTLAKRRKAVEDWAAKKVRIEEGKEKHLWDEFKERGYIKDIAGTDAQIRQLMLDKRIGAYVGIDPTAPSLHLGHLLPLMPLFWMYMHGYPGVTVLGGATAKVGDPTDRLTTRDDIERKERSMYLTKIHYQLKRIWKNAETQAKRVHGFEKEWAWSREIANNSSWYNTTSFVQVVSSLFKGIRVGPMLSRETVKRKMTDGDGMSLAEFVYPLMQAWDWWVLFIKRGVRMQIGGSDQFGNIVAGIDAVKYMRETNQDPATMLEDTPENTPVGFTVPLLTDSSGAKFGKSAGNAVWLDPFMTSSFDLYGYFMRRPDEDVEQLLKLFTFLPLEQIAEVMKVQNEDPSKRHAHHVLAYEVLCLVHNEEEAKITQEKHRSMFAKPTLGSLMQESTAEGTSGGERTKYPDKLTPAGNDLALNFRPDIQLPESLVLGESVAKILYAAGLAESSSDAHRLVSHQGAYVGGAPGRNAHNNVLMRDGELQFQTVKAWFPGDTKNFLIDDKILILRRGKHFIRIVEMVSDDEWKRSGQTYPGEAGSGRLRLLRQQLKEANDGKDANWSPNELARVSEELSKMEREGAAALEDLEQKEPTIRFPPPRSRAATLLDKFKRSRQYNLPASVEMSVQAKTAAIDKVLADAKKVLDEKRSEKEKEIRNREAWKDAGEDGKKAWDKAV